MCINVQCGIIRTIRPIQFSHRYPRPSSFNKTNSPTPNQKDKMWSHKTNERHLKKVHWRGIEPRPTAWQTAIMPLDYQCLLLCMHGLGVSSMYGLLLLVCELAFGHMQVSREGWVVLCAVRMIYAVNSPSFQSFFAKAVQAYVIFFFRFLCFRSCPDYLLFRLPL